MSVGVSSVGVVAVSALEDSAASGITFDAAANSGDIAAASSYSGSASWSGTNRMLSVDVSMLGAGVTVSSMTYGGAACTFIGAQSTVTSFGRVESWRICSSDSGAPGTGANTLAVTLSGSLEFTVEWASYTGVNQSFPVEGFNSAQATNVGSATDASVSITSVADNCWIHGAVVANDTSITANQTTRNNISGTLGSGADEDNNAAKTPAGAVTMSYSGMGITTTWAIAGYAIRPVAASNGITSGDGSITSTATITGTGASASSGVASIAGVETQTGVGASASAAAISATAAATLIGVGASTAKADITSTAVATLIGVGTNASGGLTSASGSIGATSTMTGVGASAVSAAISMSGVATLPGAGAATQAGAGSINGVAIVNGSSTSAARRVVYGGSRNKKQRQRDERDLMDLAMMIPMILEVACH